TWRRAEPGIVRVPRCDSEESLTLKLRSKRSARRRQSGVPMAAADSASSRAREGIRRAAKTLNRGTNLRLAGAIPPLRLVPRRRAEPLVHLPLDRGDDLGWLRLLSEVAGFRQPDVERRAKPDQGFAMRGPARAGQVPDLVGVGLRIVELLIGEAPRAERK